MSELEVHFKTLRINLEVLRRIFILLAGFSLRYLFKQLKDDCSETEKRNIR